MLARFTFTGWVLVLVMLPGCQNYSSGLQQSVSRVDETAALSTLHTISAAERTYSLTNAGEFGTFQQLVDGGFLDERFASARPIKDYVLSLNVTPKAAGEPQGTYSCNADPDVAGGRAGRHFYIDSTSDGIHVNDSQRATNADKVIE